MIPLHVPLTMSLEQENLKTLVLSEVAKQLGHAIREQPELESMSCLILFRF
jgi:hypothetical protein